MLTGVRTGDILDCPECGHDSYLVTEAFPETLIDPNTWCGRCLCIDDYEGRDGDCPCHYDD